MGVMWRLANRSYLNLAGINIAQISIEELKELIAEILEEGIHGISFSAYLPDQGPGSQISAEQVRERMKIIQPYVNWVRSFSCIEGNELIPKIAHEFGLKTLVGAWLGYDHEKNEQEINAVIQLGKEGFADMIAIGNEVLLRGDLSEDQIIAYMHRVKSELPHIPIGYVDAYFEFSAHPRITEACDIIMINCYPFWEGCPIEHSLLYMKAMYNHAVSVSGGKKVIIAETGWPNLGSAEKASVPSLKNAMKYFIDTYTWAEADEIEIFYFSSFDETWKIDAEGDVGAYWGLWDINGKSKYT